MPDEVLDLSHHTIAVFTLGPYATNCYVVCPKNGSNSCWIIDASFEPLPIIKHIRKNGLSPTHLFFTHAHIDHIAGAHEVYREFPSLEVAIHKAEEQWLLDPELNLSAFAGRPTTSPAAKSLLSHGDTRELARSFEVLHVPGHSPGSVAFYCADDKVAISGDAIFNGSIGRTDFPGSSPQTLTTSIKNVIYRLPDDTLLLPGHGPSTTVAHEKRTNPFVRG